MSLSFKDLKPGGLYVTACPLALWPAEGRFGPKKPTSPGSHFLVISDIPRFRRPESDTLRAYNVFINGSIGVLVLGDGDAAEVEEA